MKCLQMTHNSITLNHLKITQTWSVHLRLCQRYQTRDGRKQTHWIMVRLKLFNFHHHLLSTWPCKPNPQTIPLSLSNTDTKFSRIVHNISFIFNSDLSIVSKKQHIIKTCKTAYIYILNLDQMQRFHLSRSQWRHNQLVNSRIMSRLDYCNSLLVTSRLFTDFNRKSPNYSNKYRTLQPNASLNLDEQNTSNIFSNNCTGSQQNRIKYKTACLCYEITGTVTSVSSST